MSYNHAGPFITPGEPPRKKSHRVRNFFIGATALSIGFVVGVAIIFASIPDSGEPLEYSKPSPTLKSSADQTITPSVPKKAAIPDDGVWLVPSEVKPGTYKNTGSGDCYWERLSSTSGDYTAVITNGLGPNQKVTIKATDKAFKSQGCGGWVKVR